MFILFYASPGSISHNAIFFESKQFSTRTIFTLLDKAAVAVRVCNQNEIGDEFHYMVCPQRELLHLRTTFLTDLNMINSNFQLLDEKSLFSYIISMADTSISTITSTYFFNVFKLYNSLLK